MARNSEKAMTALARWRRGKEEEEGGGKKNRTETLFSIKLQRFKRGGKMENSGDPRGIQENVANSERRPG